ncbi:MAG: hypothetical protein GXY03_05560, partial [Solirubrobacterales bacterium]|nr:hypothetical protein [Solirubrobacterales bacterium]
MDAMAFIWMFVVLKIPIAALLWLVWWALKEPEPAVGSDEGDDGGNRRPDRPRAPRGPRRGGPHGAPPPAPPRVRTRAVA